MGEIKFFGKVDYNAKGNVSASYPAWYFTPHIEELENEVVDFERQLKGKTVPYDQIPVVENALKLSEAKLIAITDSRPKLSTKETDDLAKVYVDLGKHIADSMYSYSETMFGTADAHEVVRRAQKFCVPLSPNLAKSLFLKWDSGMIALKDATKAWKILGKLLGEPTNEEVLRRDRATARGDHNLIGLNTPHPSVSENL